MRTYITFLIITDLRALPSQIFLLLCKDQVYFIMKEFKPWAVPQTMPEFPSQSITKLLIETFSWFECLPFRRRQWHPTPVLLPGKSHGRRSLVGCSPWGRQSRTRLSDFTFTFHFPALEKEMATHSSVLAWRIPGTGSLVGRTESDTTEATQQQQQLTPF